MIQKSTAKENVKKRFILYLLSVIPHHRKNKTDDMTFPYLIILLYYSGLYKKRSSLWGMGLVGPFRSILIILSVNISYNCNRSAKVHSREFLHF